MMIARGRDSVCVRVCVCVCGLRTRMWMSFASESRPESSAPVCVIRTVRTAELSTQQISSGGALVADTWLGLSGWVAGAGLRSSAPTRRCSRSVLKALDWKCWENSLSPFAQHTCKQRNKPARLLGY